MRSLINPSLITLLLISFVLTNSYAQDFEIPDNYKLIKIEDYEPYKDLVKKTSTWLINNPFNNNIEFRQEANEFLLKWISGAPYTHINIHPEFTDSILDDDKFKYTSFAFMNYIAGMTLKKINNKDISEFELQLSGIKAMLQGYLSIRKDSRNKFLEKLYKIDKKGKLSKWIKDNWNEDNTIYDD